MKTDFELPADTIKFIKRVRKIRKLTDKCLAHLGNGGEYDGADDLETLEGFANWFVNGGEYDTEDTPGGLLFKRKQPVVEALTTNTDK